MKGSPNRFGPRTRVHAIVLALAAGAAHAGPAATPAGPIPATPALQDTPAPTPPVAQDALEPPAPGPAPTAAADARPYKSYGAAALEIAGFQLLLNRFDNAFMDSNDYHVTMGSVRRNLHSSWVEDRDPFEINQMGHPYQGSVYFNIARANGLTFWESLGYAFGASAVWEIAGENTPPSRNDQITTSFGGSFLGEAFYRMANLVLERGDGLPPRWRDAAATVVSPSLGVNRHRRPERTRLWYSNDPALLSRLDLGTNITAHGNVGPSLAPSRNEAAADYTLEYGLPGKDGYTYHRPFDYFMFRLRASNVAGVESIATRGLLFGAPYEANGRLRGIAGLYGSYDYLSPQQFRVASTGLTLGSNAQLWLTRSLALQGHASAGIGYTATGTVRASSAQQYNYGFAPQAMVTLRAIWGDRLSLDLAAREFFDGKLVSHGTGGGNDHVFRGDASLTYKIHGNHGITVKYITSRRTFSFPNVSETQQRRDTVGIYYTWQPGRGMGAVNW